MSIAEQPSQVRKGTDAEEKLIAAAADLLGEVGPRAMSVRMVAERAGVNHGLVHHYFGSKEGLTRAAMLQLVEQQEFRLQDLLLLENFNFQFKKHILMNFLDGQLVSYKFLTIMMHCLMDLEQNFQSQFLEVLFQFVLHQDHL